MSDHPTLQSEFQRAERLLGRAFSAERKVAAVTAELAALDELATPEVTASEDMRAAFMLAARGIRAALRDEAQVCPSQCGWNDPCPDPWHDRGVVPPEVRR